MKTRDHLKKHAGRDDLIGEHRWGDAGQLILLFLFLGIWVSDSFIMHWSTSAAGSVPIWIRLILGTSVLLYAWKIAREGLKIVFGEKREKPEVITKGIFSRVRHPVYNK
jgi:protein-S-isoprenylcysteine O-methyltransferase Ste14